MAWARLDSSSVGGADQAEAVAETVAASHAMKSHCLTRVTWPIYSIGPGGPGRAAGGAFWVAPGPAGDR